MSYYESLKNNCAYYTGQAKGYFLADNSIAQKKNEEAVEGVSALGMAVTGCVAAKAFISLSLTLSSGGLPITSAILLFTMTNSCIAFKNLFCLSKAHAGYINITPLRIENPLGLKVALKANTFYFGKAIDFTVDAIGFAVKEMPKALRR